MFLIWLAVLFSSISWLYGLKIYTSPVPWLGWVLIGVAALLACFGLRPREHSNLDKKILYLIIPLLLSSAILPLPYRIGPGMMALAILLMLWPSSRPIGSGFLFVGAVLVMQSLIPGIYSIISARSPTVNGMTPFIFGLLRFLRVPVSYSQNTLFFRTMRELYEIQTTWAAIGLLPALLIVAGGVAAIFFYFENVWRKVVHLVVTVGIYVVVRYVFLLVFFVYVMYFVGYDEEASKTYIFWNPVSIGISFLPFAFIIHRFFHPREKPVSAVILENLSLGPRQRVAGVLLCTGAFLLTASFGFHDPGTLKKGRFVIDEKHSEWTVTTKRYDTKWYGSESGYNYYCMAEYLAHHYSLKRNLETITPEMLDSCDVLMVKVPTNSYSEEEIDAIVDFVERGGGLFLIGDHTNVFGSSVYLNPIASRFGFKFRYDCLFDIERVFEQVYTRPRVLPHPIIQRMPPFLFAVSCSIEPNSFFPGRVILAGGLKKLDIDYSVSNFYPQVVDRLGMWFGNFHQAIATRYGRGRVVGFTDSTVYSNFSAFYPGKPEFLLGAADWLNRENRFPWVNRLLLIISLCCFLLSAYILPRRNAKNFGFISFALVGAMFSASLAILLFGAINRSTYKLPTPVSELTGVVFEQGHCDYDLPLTGFTREPGQSYEIFFQWVLRLGYYPFAVPNIEESIERGDLVVLINPVSDFTAREIDALERFVSQGGRLLVADRVENGSDASRKLLERFDIFADKGLVADASPAYEPSSQISWDLGDAFELRGGKPLLFSERAVPVMTFADHGEGLVLALSFSDAFNDAGMGFTEGVLPDRRLLHHYHLQFAIIKGLIEGNPREALINADKL
ncbi:hypothetical protein E3J62_12185 [candidate division TA06 bacterium]|uniref:DUF4350 domain-containing protein n=1 Tax=candidate division TA06 bacterium TaxID=2250710 RepID=A0A523UMP6_UNCT6|nr:MAG: hypothetical protein E3J62_12185 [candidate division TA06 bacterium]